MKECRKFSAKFNMTKITAAMQLWGPGQWPVWPVVKTALVCCQVIQNFC